MEDTEAMDQKRKFSKMTTQIKVLSLVTEPDLGLLLLATIPRHLATVLVQPAEAEEDMEGGMEGDMVQPLPIPTARHYLGIKHGSQHHLRVDMVLPQADTAPLRPNAVRE